MSPRQRLRIAAQKSGRLSAAARDVLRRCGLEFQTRDDTLFCQAEDHSADLLLVRDDDIPGLIDAGTCDLGIVGRNVLEEYALGQPGGAAIRELRGLGFGQCRLALALPEEQPWSGPRQLEGKRIATGYPRLLQQWLDAEGVEASIVTLSGSVEIAPRLGTADAVCDLVQSGRTLVANKLREVATVMHSEAVLVGSTAVVNAAHSDLQDVLLQRLDGVLDVRTSRLVMLEAPRTALELITGLLPGSATPAVTDVEGQPERIALQALCNDRVDWPSLEALRRAGAESMMVLAVEKVLA